MISICFFNNKGGVGKTTLTCNIAAQLAQKYQKRVALVDCDPQCNSSQLILSPRITKELYGADKSKHVTVLDVVEPLQAGDATINGDIKPPSELGKNRFGIEILPGHPRLSMFEDTLSQSWHVAQGGDLGGIRKSNWCDALCRVLEPSYDLVFFDIGPSLGSLNRSVLLGVDYFVTPMGCDLFSIFGIKNIAAWLDDWLEKYKNALSLCEKNHPNQLAKYGVSTNPKIDRGFTGYTVQQYIAKSKGGARRPTQAYERLLKDIPKTMEISLKRFLVDNIDLEAAKLGDVPHMYSLVPLAQSVNAPIRALKSSDGLVGAQYKQAEKYAETIDAVASALASNLGMAL